MALLRKSEIKKKFNISYTTIRKWETDGLLSTVNGLFIDEEEVVSAINRQRKKTGAEKRYKWGVSKAEFENEEQGV